jgi:FKBP-type peptidyl-prolyl cis-trans isomerase FkpA
MNAALRPRTLTVAMALALATACGSSSPVAPDQSNVEYSQTDLVVGNGPVAAAGNTVTVNYSLWLYSAKAADNKGTQIQTASYTWILGLGQLIPGFERGVTGMAVGGTRRIIVPPSLAYGSTGSAQAGIPPNAALVFEIQLVNVQ